MLAAQELDLGFLVVGLAGNVEDLLAAVVTDIAFDPAAGEIVGASYYEIMAGERQDDTDGCDSANDPPYDASGLAERHADTLQRRGMQERHMNGLLR